MSLVNLTEDFLYERLPAGLIALDERALIQAVVGGYQDRLEDLRAYGSKFQLFFSPVGLPEAGPNVVFVDFTTDQGRVVTRSLEISTATPASPAALLTWSAGQLGVAESRLTNPRLGLDILRYVDANIIDYLATNIGAVLYRSAVADQQPIVITNSGTFTATQVAHQKLIETYFPRLKFKGTARSFDALGKLLGFDDVRMVPLWSRVSPRLPNDPGAPANDADYREVPEYFPQQDLDPFYDPLQQRDGPYFHWYGTVANGTAAINYYPQVVNGYQPWMMFLEDGYGIAHGTLTHAPSGTYLLDGGAPHLKAHVAIPSTGTFYALGEGESWNGIDVQVTDLGGTLRRLDITDRLSAIKYRSSFYNLGITMDADKAEELFGTLAVRSNKDIAVPPHPYVSFSGTLYGTSPYRPYVGGTAAFQNTTGVQTSDFLTPFAGTVVFYGERHEATLADTQENFTDLAKAGQGVTQALEEVRAATRFPRRASYGYLQDDTVQYAPIPAEECLVFADPSSTVSASGTFHDAPLPPYRTSVLVQIGTAVYETNDTTDSRWPSCIFHELSTPDSWLNGFTIPSAGSYSLTLGNGSSSSGTACVNFYGTVSDSYTGYSNGTAVLGAYPDTHEVVRPDAFVGTQVFAVLGDYALASHYGPGQPAQAVADQIHSWNPEIILTTGDNNYYAGAPSTIAANNAGYLADIQQGRMFPALGNHDLDTDNGITQATFFFNGTVPGPANGRYYNVRRGNVEFFVINSGWNNSIIGGARGDALYTPTLEPDGNTFTSVQGQWLRNALRRSLALWKVVLFHEPPYCSQTTGADYSPGYPRLRWPFREWGVNAVMCGHVHSYERLVVDDLPYIITGIGGENNRVFTGFVSPGSVVRYSTTSTDYGATKITATESFLRFDTTTINGVLVDSYQIDRPDQRYMPRPEDDLDDDQQWETLDEYPYRRDILGGGELVETDYVTSSGTNFAQYSIVEQTMAVKDQTEVDFDVFVAFSQFPVPQFVIRPRPLPYKPGQRSVCFQAQFRDQSRLTVEDTDPFPMPGGRTQYYHSELDNVFQPGYQLYHAGLVNGVLVADADKFNGSHHLSHLAGWLPLNEHPEGPLTVRDAVLSLASQSLNGVAPQDRLWDNDQGFSLRIMPGAQLGSSAFRDCSDDITVSFWIKLPAGASGLFGFERFLTFGNVNASLTSSLGNNVLLFGADSPAGTQWAATGWTITDWAFVYVKKDKDVIYTGFGSLTAAVTEAVDVGPHGFTPNAGNDLLLIQGASLPYQIRDLRIWNCVKTQDEMEIVRQHQPQATQVPYRIGHVLSLNTGDRYGLKVLPTGWLAPTSMPAWVRTPKYAKVVRYDSAGEYQGEAYRRELGLGGGQVLPTPWKLGEQFYSLTGDGTVVVSPQQGVMPGSNAFWERDTAPGSYIVLAGTATPSGVTAVVTTSGSGATPWPNLMEATNPIRDSIWLENGTQLYEAKLKAAGTAAEFVTTSVFESNQQQGDTATLLATPGYYLTVDASGSVVQAAYSGTVTTPPLYMYLHETLLEDAAGVETFNRWTDPSSFGLRNGVPSLPERGQLGFTNSSTLRAGTYRLEVDLGNLGRVDDDFDGFRLDITVADTTFNKTMLAGYKGSNFRGLDELDFTLDHDIVGGWILTFDWLNSYRNPSRGQARQLAIYGYKLRHLETRAYEVSLAPSGTVPVVSQLAYAYGTVPGGWLVEVNSYGTSSVMTHEGTVYPVNDTVRTRYPLANLLTGVTAERREDVIAAGTFCLPDVELPPVILITLPSLTGVVSDSATAAPVAGASVSFTDSDSVIHMTTADGAGVYLFEDIPVGSSSLTGSAGGYISTSLAPTIASGANTQNIVLHLLPSLQGHVTDSISFGPVSGATVTVTDSALVTYVRVTGTDGFYQIPSLALGVASVSAAKTGYSTVTFGAAISATTNVSDICIVPTALSVYLAGVSPVGSGTITGLGSYTPGASATLTATGASYAADAYADILFAIDESGSMASLQYWLGRSVPSGGLVVAVNYTVGAGGGVRHNSVNYAAGATFTAVNSAYTYITTPHSKVVMADPFSDLLDNALKAAGVGAGANPNKFGIIGFGATAFNSQYAYQVPVGGGYFGTTAQCVTAADTLVTNGGVEDGYDAIAMALTEYAPYFRASAAKLVVLITDEGWESHTLHPTLSTLGQLEAACDTANMLLAAFLGVDVYYTSTLKALGHAGAVAYIQSGSSFTTGTFDHLTNLDPNSPQKPVTPYTDLVDYRLGSVWALNKVSAGGSGAQAATAAFVSVVSAMIVTSLFWQFDHWNVGGVDYYTNPLNFIVSADTPVYLYMTP